MATIESLMRKIHKMEVQLTTLDLYASGLSQMMPILIEAYNKAKENHLLEDELNGVQEQALETLPDDLHEVLKSIKDSGF